MKICNNCDAVNYDAAVRCVQCNMPNDFRLQGLTVAAPQPEKQSMSCLNCGSNEPGDGDKCAHCRFPLPGQPSSGNIIEYQPVRGRAIGDNE